MAVQIAEGLGGVPALTALAVISTGVFGAAFGPPILSAAGVRDHRAIGLALGVASHAIGTARAFQISDTAGAFSTTRRSNGGIAGRVVKPTAASWRSPSAR